MGVNSLPKTVTRQRSDCDLNPGPSAPESSTLTTRLPSHPPELVVDGKPAGECLVLSMDARTHAQTDGQPENNASGPMRCTSGGTEIRNIIFSSGTGVACPATPHAAIVVLEGSDEEAGQSQVVRICTTL